jgi:uncharacterized protein YcbX
MRVASIHVYPIKSARGLSPASAAVGDRGFEGDRRWMVVDREGKFLTQRELPRMALIEVSPDGAGLAIAAPGMERIAVSAPFAEGERTVEVWGDRVAALDAGAAAGEWMSRYLGRACALVYMPASSLRAVGEEHGGGRVGFADGFPFLVTGLASLGELHRRGVEIGMERFRPNIVVEGCGAFEEDSWKRARVGGVEMRLVKPCARCPIITVDPARGELDGREPLATLAEFRKIGGGVMFGMNAVAVGRGAIAVGDPVQVLE